MSGATRTLAALALVFTGTVSAEAGFVADFAADLQPGTPKQGWSYLYNGSGVSLGDAKHYNSLQAVPQPNNFFSNDLYYDLGGSPTLPQSSTTSYTYFGISGFTQTPGGSPGQGFVQARDGLEHYAIAAYTLSSSGETRITDSLLASVDRSVDGVHARVFVNNTDTGINALVGTMGSGSFDADLGFLKSGDTVYVAIGPGATDYADSFSLRYKLEQPALATPEPASLTMLGIGGAGLVGYRLRRRKVAAEAGGTCEEVVGENNTGGRR